MKLQRAVPVAQQPPAQQPPPFTSAWMLFRSASSCASARCHRGTYEGDEAPRLATLKYAALLGAPFIDVEYKAAATFFASECDGTITTCRIIVAPAAPAAGR